jgi:hypothetical protein
MFSVCYYYNHKDYDITLVSTKFDIRFCFHAYWTIVNKSGGLFWILSDSNVFLEEQIWHTECIYLADYFKLRKKKKKQNEMSFLITW